MKIFELQPMLKVLTFAIGALAFLSAPFASLSLTSMT
jgi:hypothetical protein